MTVIADVANTRQNFLDYVQSHRYSKLLIPILGIFGISDLPSALAHGQVPYLAITSVLIGLLFLLYTYHSIRPLRLSNAREAREFYPFLSALSAQERHKFLLPRSGDLHRLDQRIEASDTSHTVIAGASGVGKSMLISMLVGRTNQRATYLLFDETVDNCYDVLFKLFDLGSPTRSIEIEEKVTFLLGENSEQDLETDEVFSFLLSKLYERQKHEGTLHVIFDQAERMAGNFAKLGEAEQRLLIRILEGLRVERWIRTVFVVRSDLLAELLDQLTPFSFNIFFLGGIKPENNDTTFNDIKRKFLRICSHDQFLEILLLIENSSHPNTLALALAGYITENKSADYILRYKDQSGRNGVDRILTIYISLLFQEYEYIHVDTATSAELEVTLFALSLLNSKAGMACTIDDVARVGHLPTARVSRAFDYLRDRDVLKPELGKPEYFRIAHDLIADHVLRRDPVKLRLDHAAAMEQIVDRGISKEQILVVREEKDPFISSILNGFPVSFAAWLLWGAAVFYGLRIAVPERVYEWLEPVNRVVEAAIPGSLSQNPADWWLFIPIAFTQYIWVLFMYGLDRGFFKYVTVVERRPLMRFLLHMAGPLGALLGFLLSFFPSLFVIPIALPGVLLSVSYAALSMSQVKDKLVHKYFTELSIGTAVNMIIAFVVCYGLTELYILRNAKAAQFENSVSIVLVCILFCCFAFQMRGRQGSQFGRSAMLAVYDAGRRFE